MQYHNVQTEDSALIWNT